MVKVLDRDSEDLPNISSETLGKSLNTSVSQLPIYKMRITNTSFIFLVYLDCKLFGTGTVFYYVSVQCLTQWDHELRASGSYHNDAP